MLKSHSGFIGLIWLYEHRHTPADCLFFRCYLCSDFFYMQIYGLSQIKVSCFVKTVGWDQCSEPALFSLGQPLLKGITLINELLMCLPHRTPAISGKIWPFYIPFSLFSSLVWRARLFLCLFMFYFLFLFSLFLFDFYLVSSQICCLAVLSRLLSHFTTWSLL